MQTPDVKNRKQLAMGPQRSKCSKRRNFLQLSVPQKIAAGTFPGYLKEGVDSCEPEQYKLGERMCEKGWAQWDMYVTAVVRFSAKPYHVVCKASYTPLVSIPIVQSPAARAFQGLIVKSKEEPRQDWRKEVKLASMSESRGFPTLFATYWPNGLTTNSIQ